MECDIHISVERKVENKWVCVDTMRGHRTQPRRNDGYSYSFPIATSRNYDRFASLAGVRGDGPEPSGLPDNISETTRYFVDFYGGDGHSHSWLPAAEAAKIFLDTEWSVEPDDMLKKYPAEEYFSIDDGLDEHRIVFWFDS